MVKKDNIRDYATEAFRVYALLGKPTADDLKARIMRCASSEGQAFCAVNRSIPLIADVEAVDKTISKLEADNKSHIIKAVEAVYFAYPKRPAKKNEITERTIAFCISFGAAERTVFYWLKEARGIFADFRGLNADENILKSLQ